MVYFDEFAWWIEERERVRALKEAGASKPWSRDWVFQETYFCNVRREDDRVTKWIRQNWNSSHSENYELAMCVARLINWPPTLEFIGFPYATGDIDNSAWLYRAIDELRVKQANKEKIWGNAYVVTTHGQKMDKLSYLEGLIIRMYRGDELTKARNAPSLEAAWHHLTGLEGFGSFMAAQVVADLKNTEGHKLQSAPDWWTFSSYGPGSLRGLGWVYGQKVSPGGYVQHMDTLIDRLHERLPNLLLCAQDVQNCLCEFDKYMRVKTKTGRSKRKYNGV